MTSQVFATPNKALKHAIVDDGRSQRTIAGRTHIEETRLSRILSGQIVPTPKERRALSRILRRPIRELFPSPTPATVAMAS